MLSSETAYRETVFIKEDEVATKEGDSCKFCFVFQPPIPTGKGLKFEYFSPVSSELFSVKQVYCKTPWNLEL